MADPARVLTATEQAIVIRDQILEALRTMSDDLTGQIGSLNTEIGDLRSTVELVGEKVQGFRDNLTAAQEHIDGLNAQVAQLEADAAVSRQTIDALNASAVAAASAIGQATADLDSLDEALEDVSGENVPTA
jgi:uncharacterized coiled-coil protein SlyX